VLRCDPPGLFSLGKSRKISLAALSLNFTTVLRDLWLLLRQLTTDACFRMFFEFIDVETQQLDTDDYVARTSTHPLDMSTVHSSLDVFACCLPATH
jgi:hypothetical protein